MSIKDGVKLGFGLCAGKFIWKVMMRITYNLYEDYENEHPESPIVKIINKEDKVAKEEDTRVIGFHM